MRAIGVRELKARASEIVRHVREKQEELEVTVRGEVVARLVPVPRRARRAAGDAFWTDLDRLTREIGARWPKGKSAVRAVSDDRRG